MIKSVSSRLEFVNRGLIFKKLYNNPLKSSRKFIHITTNVSQADKQDFKEDTNKKKLNNDIAFSQTTVDHHEVDHHSALKHEWWDTASIMRGLHSMNKLRVPFIRDGLLATNPELKNQIDTPLPLKGMKVLEVGCGGGILCEPLSRIGADVSGIDASGDLINLAREHSQESSLTNIKYVHDTIEDFSDRHRGEFNAVVASEVIEHVTNKEYFVESCVKCLKPGGSIFITTLNKTNLAWLGGIVIAENILNIVPSGTHQWEKFISPHDMSRMLEKYNCKTKLLHGMLYFFINNEWYWCRDTSINYAIQAIKKEE